MAALVQQHREGLEPVGQFHVFVRNLVYYLGFRQELLPNDDSAAAFMRSADRVLMVVRDTDLARLETTAGLRMRRLGEVRYFNTANIKFRSLLSPSPEQDLQRVLLVSNR